MHNKILGKRLKYIKILKKRGSFVSDNSLRRIMSVSLDFMSEAVNMGYFHSKKVGGSNKTDEEIKYCKSKVLLQVMQFSSCGIIGLLKYRIKILFSKPCIIYIFGGKTSESISQDGDIGAVWVTNNNKQLPQRIMEATKKLIYTFIKKQTGIRIVQRRYFWNKN